MKTLKCPARFLDAQRTSAGADAPASQPKEQMPVHTIARERCDAAEQTVNYALEATAYGSLMAEHLERARAHINEAWIAADGQNARSVERLLADLAEGDKLRLFALTAKRGDTVEAFGKLWEKQ
jgi:hypothetical protein